MPSVTSISISNRSILAHFNPTKSFSHCCLKDSSFPHTCSASSASSIFCRRIDGSSELRSNSFNLCVPQDCYDDLVLSVYIHTLKLSYLLGRNIIVQAITVISADVFWGCRLQSKWIAAIIVNGYILWRHDAESLWFALGCALNKMLSVQLKQIINQERPSILRSDPGMPSSHAQTFYFIAMLAILSSIKRIGMNEFTITISGLALAFGSYLSYLRVSQQFHTVSQVVVGGGLGLVCGWSWFWVWNNLVANVIESFFPLKLLLISISLATWFGYTFYSIHQGRQRRHD